MKRGLTRMTVGSGHSSREAVSALVDGELRRADSDPLLHRVARDPALRASWTRYHATRAALRGSAVALGPDFADRVAQCIAEETAPQRRSGAVRPQQRQPQRAAARLWTGLALAAGLSTVALAGWIVQGQQHGASDPGSDPGSAPLAAAAPEVDGLVRTAAAGRNELLVPVLRPPARPQLRLTAQAGRRTSSQLSPARADNFSDYAGYHTVSAGGGLPVILQSGRLAGHRPEQ